MHSMSKRQRRRWRRLKAPHAKAALPGGDCIEPCVREMQSSLEQTPMLQSEQLGQLSFTQLAGHSHDRQHTQDAFSLICQLVVLSFEEDYAFLITSAQSICKSGRLSGAVRENIRVIR
ncbi:hypothetical protein ANCDUO_11316 [Ancylostoma duodenale]|uniref:Uncharacterized protein n=1 Tax=Ancylostoma duodenale TaxID=51022 RepID=A0A0C2GI08_9BILA|nr:hypothetical protein ANCDUO_11316 [Ancylostoma duodenale]